MVPSSLSFIRQICLSLTSVAQRCFQTKCLTCERSVKETHRQSSQATQDEESCNDCVFTDSLKQHNNYNPLKPDTHMFLHTHPLNSHNGQALSQSFFPAAIHPHAATVPCIFVLSSQAPHIQPTSAQPRSQDEG